MKEQSCFIINIVLGSIPVQIKQQTQEEVCFQGLHEL